MGEKKLDDAITYIKPPKFLTLKDQHPSVTKAHLTEISQNIRAMLAITFSNLLGQDGKYEISHEIRMGAMEFWVRSDKLGCLVGKNGRTGAAVRLLAENVGAQYGVRIYVEFDCSS